MATIADLVVRYRADTGAYTRGAALVDRTVERQRASFLSFGRLLAGAAVAGGAAVAARRIFDLGAAVEETASKYNTVFGPAVATVNTYLAENARLLGLTDEEAQGIIATTGAIAQGMGFAQRASADFAVEVTRLAGDLASFNNIPITETSRAIQAALTGERESLKRLGVVILESDVQRRALANSSGNAALAATQQARATATLQLITERAGVAVGDLARTQDSAANRARAVGATFRQFRDDVATGLLPTMRELLGITADNSSAMGELGEAFKRNGERIAAWVRFSIESFQFFGGTLLSLVRISRSVGNAIGFALRGAIEFSVAAIIDKLNGLVGYLNGLIELYNRITAGPDIDFRIGGLDAQVWFDGAAASGQQAADAIGAVRSELGAIAGRFVEMRNSAVAAWTAAAGEVTDGAATGGGGGGGGGDTGGGVGNAAQLALDAANQLVAAWRNVGSASRSATDEMVTGASDFASTAQGIAGAFADTFVNSITGVEEAFKSFFQSALRMLLELLAKLALFKALSAAFPGSFGAGGLLQGLFGFGGARANGGPVQAGTSYLVGEKGPERFVPNSSGTIVPNGGMTFRIDWSDFPKPASPREAANLRESLELFSAQVNAHLANGGGFA